MLNTTDSTKSQNPSQNIHTIISELPFPQQNLIKIPAQDLISLEGLASLNSFSLKNFMLVSEEKQVSYELRYFDRQYQQNCIDDPLYNVLSLKKGKSQYFHDQESQAHFTCQFFSDYPTSLSPQQPNQQRRDNFDSFDYNHFETHDSKDRSTFINEPSIDSSMEIGQKKISTKNVTKNMGKLLFKFIWKNRMKLRKQLNIDDKEWQHFIGQIRIWKKENNITREYLNNKWHCHQQNSKLFRTISHYFFRKRCLSAIIESHIQNKQMHIKRLKRFQDAIWDPKALDNLN